MKDKPNYYSVIPANVRYDDRLRDKSKLLYGEISSLCNKSGYCTASNKYFAELYNVSVTTISTLIGELIKCGYLFSDSFESSFFVSSFFSLAFIVTMTPAGRRRCSYKA